MNLPPDKSIIDFIKSHKNDSVAALMLKYGVNDSGFPIRDIAIQIEARNKCKYKLSGFLQNDYFLFPDNLSSEQSTDERVARYHSEIIGEGRNVIDMTAGLGIDSMTFAKNGNNVTAIEIDEKKAALLKYNADILGIKNIRVLNVNSVDYINGILPELTENTVIYIDPARRDNHNNRTYSFSYTIPDITLFYKTLLQRGCRVIVKASPLLDLSSIIETLTDINKIHIVSVKGECKEILIDMSHSSFEYNKRDIEVICVDLNDTGIKYNIGANWEDIKNSESRIIGDKTELKNYWLYEPDSTIMKLPGTGIINILYPELWRMSSNTGLYVGLSYIPDFPGRKLKISGQITKRDFKRLRGQKYNVAVRNYPLRADELRKQIGVTEGNEKFIYGFRMGSTGTSCLIEAIKISD